MGFVCQYHLIARDIGKKKRKSAKKTNKDQKFRKVSAEKSS